MSTVHLTSHSQHTADDDHRFAELVARVGLEPDLGQRYAADPVSVMTELGLSAAEPFYTGRALVMEDLDRPDPAALALLTGIPRAL
ncbi:hypothetical protein ACWD4B_13260 [Streptomyces sp. NPDC002536]